LPASWRTPLAVLAGAAIVLALALGVRQSFGLLLPAEADLGWGRADLAFALVLSSLIWGLSQPLFGALADRGGADRVVAGCGLLLAGGLALMPLASTPLILTLSAGLLLGVGLGGTSFAVVLGAVGRAFAPERRNLVLGIACAGGAFGQFLALPSGPLLISALGWRASLLLLAGIVLAIVPLAMTLKPRSPDATPDDARQALGVALREARADVGFRYLVAGFFVSGGQIVFILGHLPAYLLDARMTPAVGATALALIGLFSVAGCLAAGYLGGHLSRAHLLSGIHVLRAVLVALFLGVPASPLTVCLFAAGIGFLWLGPLPLASGLVLQRFGTRYACTLLGILFFAYQLGGVIAMWLSGHSVDTTRSYDPLWAGSMALGIVAAILNLGIDEQPVARAHTDRPSAAGWRTASLWVGLAILCPALVVFALRGYHAPPVLIDFANIKLCTLSAVTG
jgi:predicted MFS family arabinose efflux permease